MLKKKIFKSVISISLAVCMLFASATGALASEVSDTTGGTTLTGANKRINTSLKMAAGKQITNDDVSTSLTEAEMQFLGVYVSNFFVPFGTELGVASNDNDVTTQNKEDIKKALQTGLDYSDSLADSLTETLLGLSRSSITNLDFYVSKKYQEGYVKVPIASNYFNFLRCMLGRSNNLFTGYDSDGNGVTVIKDIKSGNYKYGYFAYTKNGTVTPVADCVLDGTSSYTAFQLAFLKCLESVDIAKGYGFNFFDFTSKEVNPNEDFSTLSKDMSESDAYKSTMWGINIAVDCFGNIILMGGNHQFVAVPGCMNPYTWCAVDSTGKDSAKPGEVYNIVNIPSMVNADSGKLFSGTPEKIDSEEKQESQENQGTNTLLKSMKVKLTDLTDQLKNVVYDASAGSYSLRLVRGDSSSTFGKVAIIATDADTRDLALLAQKGFIAANSKDKTYYYTKGLGSGEIKDSWFTATTSIEIAGPINSKFSGSKKVKFVDSIAVVDNLGTFHFGSDDQSLEYNAIQVTNYLSEDGSTLGATNTDMSIKADGFSSIFKSIQDGKMQVDSINASDSAIVSLFVSYVFAGLYDDSCKEDTIGKLGYKLNKDGLPDMPNKPLELSSSAQSDIMLTEIRNWLYYLLHPTEGLTYFRILITNKLNSFLLGWHNDMVGTNGVGNITGTTTYRNSIGYVTTPDLSDIQWTSALMDLFDSAIPFLIVIMIVTMLFAYVSGILSLQKSIFGVVLFVLFLAVPTNTINGVVMLSNNFSTRIYGEKFTYWALVQQESYATDIDNAANGDSYSNYLKTLYSANSKVYSNQGGESVVLKWQAPKKMSSIMLSKADSEKVSGLSDAGRKMMSTLMNTSYSGESYIDNQDTVYMYRSYLDISNFSRYIYRGIKEAIVPSTRTLNNTIIGNFDSGLKSSIKSMNSTYENDRSLGYTNATLKGSKSIKDSIRIKTPISSRIIGDALAQKGKIPSLTINKYVGLNQNLFNFSIPMFTKGATAGGGASSLKAYLEANLDSGTEEEKKQLKKDMASYSNKDFTGLAAYGLYSENVFYYFSWLLYDLGLQPESSATDGYKNLLLGTSNGGFFYNVEGNGEMKDFMDMKSLFTYIIPYLKQCNEIVKEWDDVYGYFLYDGVPYEEGKWNEINAEKNEELKNKYWHNLNVARLYQLYSPWVDIMYECSYAQPETIKAYGVDVKIEDPLNPASYPSNRPMIFSESEMKDYGMEMGDLTKAEKLILKCNKGMQDRMYELLNYYNFSDVTLDTAAAMNCAFEFNTVFSESGIFTDNHNIYPQSFEIDDFSYDAFLRFILANNTGEDLLLTGNSNGDTVDFYSRIVNNSSMTTALVIILLDIISVYILPSFKIFFLMAIYILSILIILVTAFRVDAEHKFLKKILKSVIMPMIYFLATTVGFAFVISLFMGKGNNGVTQSNDVSIAMGDPVTAMIAIIVVDAITLYIYFKLLSSIIRDLKFNAKLAVNFVKETYSSVGNMVTGGLIAAGGVVGARASRSTSGGSSGQSSGSSSSRARVRASKNAENVGYSEDEGSSTTRRNDVNRKPIESPNNKSKSNDRNMTDKDINSVVNSGRDKVTTETTGTRSSDTQTRRMRESNSNRVKDTGRNGRGRNT